MYENDPLASILADLRKRKIIQDFQVKNSRFNVSHNELHKPEVKEAIAEALGVKPENIRLPRVIEWNYIGNAFHNEWGNTNTWEWFEDDYMNGQRRLYGGLSENGGLSSVNWFGPDYRHGNLGFRPLVVFSEE